MSNKTMHFTFTQAISLVLLLVLAGLLGACEDDTVASCTPEQTGGSNVVVANEAAFNTRTNNLVSFTTTIPCAVSMGLVLQGSPANFILIEHQNILGTGLSDAITGPDGSSVPLSFNMLDANGDGVDETRQGDNLFNRNAEALFFPNNGESPSVFAGDYTFPVGAAIISNSQFTVDTIQPTVFYKTSANTGQTMDVNLFVVSGVGPGITSLAAAEADAEIIGAIAVLKNVYQNNSLLGLTVNVNVVFIADTNFIILETEAEQDLLLSTNPAGLPGNALNLFIVGSLAYLPGGVIGVSAGIPGPFKFDGTIVSGTLAEYQSDGTGTILGFTLAHEFGHYLGLWHTSQTNSTATAITAHDPIGDTAACTTSQVLGSGCPDETNLMFPFVSNNTNPPISAGQAQVILKNPAIFEP